MKKVIKAGAGTGKTYRLSLEYLAALLKGIDFSEIIVMTFTKKATAEIKNRILSHLRAIITDAPDKKAIIKALRNIYPELEIKQDRLEKIYREMILNDEEIKISTIDAFTNQIFSRAIAPFLDIYNYQIIDESQNEKFIAEILKKLLNKEEYYNQLQGFLEANTARDLDPYLDFIKEIAANFWKFIIRDSAEKEKLPQAELTSLFDSVYQTLKEVAEMRGEKLSASYFVKAGRAFYEQYPELKTKKQREKFLYQKRDYLLKESFWNGNKLRAKKTADLKEKLEFEYDLFCKKLAAVIYNQEVIPAEKEIINFAELVLDIYEEIKLKSAQFTHSDISNYTFKYLKNEEIGLIKDDQVTDYFLDLLGGEYKALFIDEFQDTSILQWKILKPLIKRAANFIAVGDEKQSIYGWRGGEKKLFSSLAEIIGAETERLEHCFRSDQEIISFLNSFFSKPDVDWEYQAVKPVSEAEGLIRVLYGGESAFYNTKTKKFKGLSPEKQAEIEEINAEIKDDLPAEIAAEIKENQADNYGQLNLLARTSKELSLLAQSLEKEGVPYILENRNSLLEAALPKALTDFLYFAAYRDFYSLLKFLRSDLVKLSSRQFKLILKHQKELEKYFNSNLVQKLPGELRTEKGLAKQFRKIKEALNLDYSQLIDYLYQKTEVLKLAADNSLDLKNLYHFFEILNSFTSFKKLFNYLSQNRDSEELKQQKVENKDAVTLMTIHQAKGLSLPIEYFYWNPGRKSGRSQKQLNLFLDFDEQYQQLDDYLFIQNEYLSILDWLDFDFKAEAEKKAELEEINNLYVALSRAEKELHLYVEAPRKIKLGQDLMWKGSSYDYYEKMLLAAVEADNLLELLQSEKKGSRLQAETEKEGKKYQLSSLNKYLKQSQKKSSKKSASEEEKYSFFKQQSSGLKLAESKIKGLALHYYLENIKYNNQSEKSAARRLLKSKYGNLLGADKTAAVIKKADQFIANNAELFSDKYQILTEYLLKEDLAAEKKEKRYRIDRLLVDRERKEIKIIDYKSGSYRDPAQLEKYQELLSRDLTADWQLTAEFVNI